jgi:teichuronic acid biosynthesis glycosyltransferase TuaC
MKILIVCSSRARNEGFFTSEQAMALRKKGHSVELFYMKGRGVYGYLASWFPLVRKIAGFKPDILHAHYGLSGFVAVFQLFRPVVITVHGGDIYTRRNALFTQIACLMASGVIVVNEEMKKMLWRKSNVSVLPCGVDTSLFVPGDSALAREVLNYDRDEALVLFSSRFSRPVKNYELASAAIAVSEWKPRLIELVNIDREQMPMILNAVDAVLVTSHYEGSPQIIKEAMAMNVPVVSTDVGDIKKNVGGLDGYFISGFDPSGIASLIDRAISFRRNNHSTGGRERIIEMGLDSDTIISRLIKIYSDISGK